MPTVSPLTVKSVSAFLRHIEQEKEAEQADGNNADFIFRGQRTDEPLLPRLARVAPDGQFLEIEQLMFKEFQRTSLALTDRDLASKWDCLSLAQHHGLPTRLLDWTYSALAGLWFCVAKPPKKERGDLLNGVVWLLKTRVEDFVDEDTRTSPFDNGITRIYRPRVITRRIAAQSGLFTIHKVLKGETLIELERNKHFVDRLVKFVIPGSAFKRIRAQLHGCGVNRLSLFPDLDGLSAHLAWLYTGRR
jgi:hypothetical protein